MQAQQQAVVAQTQASQAADGLIELDLATLAHVGGGAPKGTWNDAGVLSAISSDESGDLEPAPKGTW